MQGYFPRLSAAAFAATACVGSLVANGIDLLFVNATLYETKLSVTAEAGLKKKFTYGEPVHEELKALQIKKIHFDSDKDLDGWNFLIETEVNGNCHEDRLELPTKKPNFYIVELSSTWDKDESTGRSFPVLKVGGYW